MAALGGSAPARFSAIILASVLLGLAAPASAPAACEICDQYTLDIPDPKGNEKAGSGGGSQDQAPAPAPAPAATPAPAPVPAPASATAQPEPKKTEKRAKPKPKPRSEPPRAPVVLEPAAAASTPLAFDDGSGSEALLGGLGDAGTLGLLLATIAAGGTVAYSRRSRRD